MCAVINYHEGSKTFHSTNGKISYIMKVLQNNQLGQLYYGKAIEDADNFDHLLELYCRGMGACVFEGNKFFSLEKYKARISSIWNNSLPSTSISNPSTKWKLDHHTNHTQSIRISKMIFSIA